MDVDALGTGQDYGRVIDRAVASSRAVLILIGDSWRGEWLEDANDFVRRELQAALTHGQAVIPVLIGDVSMLRAQGLPDVLRPLARYPPIHLRPEYFSDDVSHLIERVEQLLTHGEPSAPLPSDDRQRLSPLYSRRLVFVSYSHADEYWLGRLQIHLKPLLQHGRLETWDDTQIEVGDEWRKEIRRAIESCAAAVLLVSADFMASDFIAKEELPALLLAARARGVRIMPIIVSSSHFVESQLGCFQSVNDPARPLDMLPRGEQEAVFAKLHAAVRSALT